MPIIEGVIFCENCGIEIRFTPYIPNQKSKNASEEAVYYCCQECYQGYQCLCSNSIELEEDRRSKNISVIDSNNY